LVLAPVLALVFTLGFAAPTAAQTIRGIVLDGTTGQPLPFSVITLATETGQGLGTVLSGQDGSFTFPTRTAGAYILEITRIGYVTVGPQPLEITAGETLNFRVELLQAPVLLDAITASGARQLYNEGSVIGALARREVLPEVGSRRVVVPTDVEMLNAMDVSDVLQWFPPPRGCRALTDLAQVGQARSCGCTIVHWNGHPVQHPETADYYLTLNPGVLQAVEYYRYWLDAPSDLKDYPLYIDFPDPCAVVALWPRVMPL
jgi:hypothetical protein